ncbi:MAG: winged helix-turn-helix transcriptional regulator [Vicingus serpentipes]|nr:winged helix-turn-helix transcriptional regulator [Vicingus serpentipes]
MIPNVRKSHLLIRAINHPIRKQILSLLLDNTLNVTELCTIMKRPQPDTSRHLKILRQSKMINNHRKGSEVYYTINPNTMKLLNEITDKINLL